jgi:hypothetical protein
MRELSADELHDVIGGTVFSYPRVYIQETEPKNDFDALG